jgi:prepilin-type N-terminal cleavage/methylation domain-containing protein
MKKKISKKLKGMTLIEIIISIAVFAVMGLMLVTAATSINQHTKSANKLNKKVAVQGPIAEAQYKNDAYLVDDDVTIKVNGSIEIKGKAYSVVDPTAPTDDEANSGLNFQFIADMTAATT